MSTPDNAHHATDPDEQCDESIYRSIVREFPANLVVAHIRDKIVTRYWVGSGVADLYGCRIDEMESDPMLWLRMVHPADAERVRAELERMASGQTVTDEFRILRKDGQTRWVRVTCTTTKGPSTDVSRVLALVQDITSEKTTSAQLEQCRRVLDESPVAVSVQSIDGRMIYCNRRCAELFGTASADEMLGTVFEDLLPEEFREEFERRVRPRLPEGPWVGEGRIRRTDGEIRFVSAAANLLKDAEGNPAATYTTLTDITDRRDAEEALRGSESLLRSILNAIAAHVAVLDRNGNIIAVNDAWNRYARENGDPTLTHTGVGVNYLDVCRRARGLYSEGAREALEGLQAVLGGFTDAFELEYHCPTVSEDGWFVMRASPMRVEKDGLVVSHINITGRKHMEQALIEREEKLRSLLEGLDAVVFRLDADFRPLALAGRVKEISGYEIPDFMADPQLWQRMVHPDDAQTVCRRYADATSSRTPIASELRLIVRSGETRCVRTHVTPRFDEQGTFLYFDGVGVDVTDEILTRQREARRTARIAALSDIGRKFSTSLDFNDIVGAATRRVSETLDCLCTVISVEPMTGRLEYLFPSYGDDPKAAEAAQIAEREPLTAEDVFGAEGILPRASPDVKALSPALARFADRTGVGPGVIAPIYVTGERSLVLACARLQGQDPFDEDDVWFLEQVSSHLSATLANVKLYSRQARIAETLQRSLIPEGATIPGMDIATRYSPASGEAEVGGDFFDVVDLPNGLVGVVVGDVSGKGVDAAIHTAEAKYMLRGFALQDPDPGFVVRQVNYGLCRLLSAESFITLIYVLIDPSSHTLHYVNAGHDAPLILCLNTRLVHEMKPNGPVLGVVPVHTYKAGQMTLEEDDLLLCYTDGVTDVPRDGERFGYQRLVETISRASVSRSNELLEYIMQTVRDFGGGRQPDDQVVVVVRPER